VIRIRALPPCTKNYFKVAWRYLLTNKGYSFINISGLAIGTAVAMLIGLWIFDELSFNRSFKNYDRLYNIYRHLTFDSDTFTESGVSPRLVYELRNSFPEFKNVALTSYHTDNVVSYNENKFLKPQPVC
jgi:hypothetical protein